MTAARVLAMIAAAFAAAALAAAIPARTEVVELHRGPAGSPDAGFIDDAGFLGDAFPDDDGGDPLGDASAFGDDGGPAFPLGDGGGAD